MRDSLAAVKEYESISNLIGKLSERKMQVKDEAFAEQWLCNVGYYRLSAYWYPNRIFEHHNSLSRGNDFVAGTCFEDVAALYEFDRKLRTLAHDGIERIEIGLRAQLNEHLGQVGGALAYLDSQHFRPGFDHEAWKTTAYKRIRRAKNHSEAIRHHFDKCDGQIPIWVLSEVLDFSDVSKLFEGLPTAAQYSIAENLGITIDTSALSSNQRSKAKKNHPLVRWFEHLAIIRNTAAHHARLWNRSFTPVSTTALRTMSEFDSLAHNQSEQVYGALTVMNVLLRKLSPSTSWPTKVRALILDTFSELQLRHPSEMGCPENWQDASVWCE